jgi:hypothetical protein
MKSKAVWIGCVMAALFCGSPANADVIITLKEVGNNVVATYSGTVDLTALTLKAACPTPGVCSGSFPGMGPSNAVLAMGVTGALPVEYFGPISGPNIASGGFGPGAPAGATAGTGARFGVSYQFNFGAPNPPEAILVPAGYVSGTFLSGTATWNNTTFAALGVTPGTYTWTWGSGRAHSGVKLSAVVIPEPSTLLTLGTGLLGLAGVMRRKLQLGT